jgi:hypothetical protein
MKPYCTESKKDIRPTTLDTQVSVEDNPFRSYNSIKKQREEARYMKRYEKKQVRKALQKELEDDLESYYIKK